MKGWEIVRCITKTRELMHDCGDWGSKNKLLNGKICTRDPDGKWICLNCGAYAPEEVGFAAELANCREVSQDNQVLTNLLKRLEK